MKNERLFYLKQTHAGIQTNVRLNENKRLFGTP